MADKNVNLLKREVDEARLETERNADELSFRMSSRELYSDAEGYFRPRLRRNGSRLLRISSWLAGSGLGMLLLGQPRGRILGYINRARGRVMDASGRMSGRASEMYHEASDRAHDMTDRIRDRAHDMREGMSEKMSSPSESSSGIGERMSESVTDIRYRASDMAGRTKQSLFSHPLLLGSIGLIIGAAISGSIRASEAEKKAMSRTAEKIAV